MAENSFRILLDFRELNFKFYKFVWMSVLPRELVTIKDLKDAILKKFSFERTDLQLFLRDGLLPEDENISNILRENDSVRLFYDALNDLNESRTTNYEETDPSSSDDQVTSSKKRKTHSDVSVNSEENEQVKSNKKRKHSFSNGTYLFENNNTPETSAVINTSQVDRENSSLSNFDNIILNSNYKSCKIKKQLKYTNDIPQNSKTSENETFMSSDTIPRSEKNESRVNSCKKKKKHKHSKDLCVSRDDIISYNDVVIMNENQPKLSEKKKKRKHSHKTKTAAVSFSDEINCIAEKSNESGPKSEISNTEQSKLHVFEKKKSVSNTVIKDSEVLPVSFCASSVNTSSGIGSSKGSEENNQNTSPQKNSSVSDRKLVSELEKNDLSGQGNNCKKKKRKRHRKRKSVDPQVDISNDWNLDVSQKIENKDSTFASSSYQTAEISSRNLETPDPSMSNAYISARNVPLMDLKRDLLKQFDSRFLSTSTPFAQPLALSGLKNAMFPSNVSQDQSYAFSASWKSNKKMNENSLPFHSMPYDGSKNKNNALISNHKFDEKKLSSKQNHSPEKSADTLSNKGDKSRFQNSYFSYEGSTPLSSCPPVGTPIAYKNENSLSTHSTPSDGSKNKNNATNSSHKLDEKDLSFKQKVSPQKSTDSFSNKETKSHFQNPNFSYESCPPLNSCPLVGTYIAYKVLELDASYSPVVSNYKEGIVKAVNPQTDELEIELIEPEVKEGRFGKFENVYDDELPQSEVVRKATLSWPSLINPVQVTHE